MRRLMLLRHAKTEIDAPSGLDRDRRLNDRGRIDAAAIGGWIGRKPPFPDLVLVSPAVRAQQTWETVLDSMKDAASQPRVEFLPQLYGADPTQLLRVVHAASATDPRQMMVIGHNPGIHELALLLTGGGDTGGRKMLADNMPTSGLAVLDFPVEDWGDVSFRRGELVAFVSPKTLKENPVD